MATEDDMPVEAKKPDRGEPSLYEVTWTNGHVDRIKAHQVTQPGGGMELFAASFGLPSQSQRRRVEFHGEFDGRWQLVLSADADDIKTIRNLTHADDLGEQS
jgi:hypothetical protein